MTAYLNLYSTTHCHLCEQAEELLLSLASLYDIEWQIIEIADEDALLERYSLKIPVVRQVATANELCWPFNDQDIIAAFKLQIR